MTFKKLTIAAVVAAGPVIGLLLTVPAWSHEDATGVVKERMDTMKAIGEAMKGLTAMFKGERPYDATEVKKLAASINSRAGHVTKLFPKGSLQKPTEALPAIWEKWPTFERYSDDLRTFSAALESAADNDFGPMHGGSAGSGQHMMGRGPMMGSQGSGPMMGGQGPGGGPMTGGQGWGGGPGMTGDHPMNDPEALKQMPPMASFMRLTQTCNACHTEFRQKKK